MPVSLGVGLSIDGSGFKLDTYVMANAVADLLGTASLATETADVAPSTATRGKI